MKTVLDYVTVAIMGPRSRYQKALPYAYSARKRIFEDAEEHAWYVADTICQLIEQLVEAGVNGQDVELFEVFQQVETPIDRHLYCNEHGHWHLRPHLCHAFAHRYPSHPCDGSRCAFDDRH